MMKRSLGILLLGLLALSARANNLVNGDFESGNTGFTTSPGYTINETVGLESTYTVNSIVPNGWSPSFGDHTSGSGNMLIVNAATDADQSFWIQSLDVVFGVEYTFTGWVATLTVAPTPTLQFKINGIETNTFAVANIDDTWQEFSFNWTASATESITLSLTDTVRAAIGDDFAIDDLSVVPEPASAALLGFAATLLFAIRRYTAK